MKMFWAYYTDNNTEFMFVWGLYQKEKRKTKASNKKNCAPHGLGENKQKLVIERWMMEIKNLCVVCMYDAFEWTTRVNVSSKNDDKTTWVKGGIYWYEWL